MTLRLLLVEDDAMLGAAIRFGLSQDQFVVDWVQDGLAAETALESQSYCAVVLDLGPPGKRAFALLEALHRPDRSMPVVIISAHDGTAERLAELATRIRTAIQWHANRAERESATIALPFSWG